MASSNAEASKDHHDGDDKKSGIGGKLGEAKDHVGHSVDRVGGPTSFSFTLKEEKTVAVYPSRPLRDPAFTRNLRPVPGDPILCIDKVDVYEMLGTDKNKIASNLVWEARRVEEQEHMLLWEVSKLGETPIVRFFSDQLDSQTFRVYNEHYLVCDNTGKFFLIEVPKDTQEEEINKIEVLLSHYTCFFRQPGMNPDSAVDIQTGKLGTVANGLESSGRWVGDKIAAGGKGVSKGAHKISEAYCRHTKEHDSSEDKSLEQAEDKADSSFSGRVEYGTDKIAETTAAARQGVEKAFGKIGETVGKGVHKGADVAKDSDLYKEHEEKKKEKEEQEERDIEEEAEQAEDGEPVKSREKKGKGIKEIGSAGVGMIKAVTEGVEQAIAIGASGIRDAAVDKSRYRHGDLRAEKNKKRWDAVGSCGMALFNITRLLALLPKIWIKGAIYAGKGLLKYDPNLPQQLTGGSTKEGWLMRKNNFQAAGGWDSFYAKLRIHTLALYRSPEDPDDQPVSSVKIAKLRRIDIVQPYVTDVPHAFELTTANTTLYFSTECSDLDWSQVHKPDPAKEMCEYVNMISTLNEFLVPQRILKKMKKQEKRQEEKEAGREVKKITKEEKAAKKLAKKEEKELKRLEKKNEKSEAHSQPENTSTL